MVRSDKSLGKEFSTSKEWLKDELTGRSGGQVERYQLNKVTKAKMSFSGSERNSVFSKSNDGHFVNISGVSGMDSKSDGRSVGIVDLNRDGFNDFLFTSANKPTLAIFENRIPTLGKQNNFVAVRVVGGNTTDKPVSGLSTRDGIGALIRVASGDATQIREVRCGEGLATQNSRLILFGLGSHKSVDSIEVRWPGGKTSRVGEIGAGKIVEVFESPESISPDFKGYKVTDYQNPNAQIAENERKPVTSPLEGVELGGKINVITGMATWCEACQKRIPDLNLIKEKLGDQIQLNAISIDAKDTQKKLSQYVDEHAPPYKFLTVSDQQRVSFVRFAAEQMGSAGTPFTVVVSDSNEVLMTSAGVPTISDLEKVIRARE